MKREVFVFLIIGIIIFWIGFVFAQQNKQIAFTNCKYLSGDSNGDDEVDVSDVIIVLKWLFFGEVDNLCFENSDANDDNEIDISDPMIILNWLFQGGEQLVNKDIPISLWVGITLTPEEMIRQTDPPEFTLEIPGVIYAYDFGSDPFHNALGCVATKKVFGSEQEPIIFYESDWSLEEDREILKGRDMKRNYVNMILDFENFVPGNSYEINTECWEERSKDEVTIIVHTLPISEEKLLEGGGAGIIPPPVPDDEFTSSGQIKKCCEIACKVDDVTLHSCESTSQSDCEYGIDWGDKYTHSSPNHVCKDYFFEKDPSTSAISLKWHKDRSCVISNFHNDGVPRCTGTDKSCEVDKITIVKEGDRVKSGMDSIYPFYNTYPVIGSHRIRKPGHHEGWAGTRSRSSYGFGYLFYVEALLRDGSDPSQCFTYQYVQDFSSSVKFYLNSQVPGGRLINQESLYIYPFGTRWAIQPNGLEGRVIVRHVIEKNDILYYKRLYDQQEPEYLLPSAKFIYKNDITKNLADVTDPILQPCAKTSSYDKYCTDNYKEPFPGALNHILGFDFKNGDKPKIIFRDFPSMFIGEENILNFDSEAAHMRSGPQDVTSGSLDLREVLEIKNSFISIVEDSDGEERGVCMFGVENPIHFKNDPDIATRDKKMQLVSPPSCECFRQKWEDVKDIWEEIDGSRHSCEQIS